MCLYFRIVYKKSGAVCAIFLDYMDSSSQTYMKWPLEVVDPTLTKYPTGHPNDPELALDCRGRGWCEAKLMVGVGDGVEVGIRKNGWVLVGEGVGV